MMNEPTSEAPRIRSLNCRSASVSEAVSTTEPIASLPTSQPPAKIATTSTISSAADISLRTSVMEVSSAPQDYLISGQTRVRPGSDLTLSRVRVDSDLPRRPHRLFGRNSDSEADFESDLTLT